MGDTTDDLIDLAKQVCTFGGSETTPPKREMDQLLATGEQVTIALMAMAIHAQGHEAISFTGGQIGLVTDDAFTKARIQSINKQRIFDQLDAGKIVIVAGFQGITPDGRHHHARPRRDRTRRWSRSARCSKADVCENYTDVDGIYTADPRIVKNARKIDRISYDEMLELSGPGRERAADAGGRVRQEVQRADPRAEQPERQRGHLDRRGDPEHGTHRRHPAPPSRRT